jgi:hypothetical protein
MCSRKKDTEALKKLTDWFVNNNPFDTNYPALRSLSSEITATSEDNINCDDAENVGTSIQKKLDTLSIEDCKIKRTNQVRTLVRLQNGIKAILFTSLVHFSRLQYINIVYLIRSVFFISCSIFFEKLFFFCLHIRKVFTKTI